MKDSGRMMAQARRLKFMVNLFIQ